MGKTLNDIIGQDKVVSSLKAQLSVDRLSHSYIFLGPAGIGKKYLAKVFSRHILCESQRGDKCESCTAFERSAHPDFITVSGEDGIKIQDIRDAIERINLSPVLSKRKVFLVTNGEKMGIESVNALLKTLEEPPLDTVIILTAISEESLAPTMVSRAQLVKLSYLPENALKLILSEKYPEKKIDEVLKYSGGNIGDTVSLLENRELLQKRKEMYSDALEIIEGQTVLEKFLTVGKYDKNKMLNEFFEVFSSLLFRSLQEDLGGLKCSNFKKYKTQEKSDIGKKILKINRDLRYNINLRLAMETLILETMIR